MDWQALDKVSILVVMDQFPEDEMEEMKIKYVGKFQSLL